MSPSEETPQVGPFVVDECAYMLCEISGTSNSSGREGHQNPIDLLSMAPSLRFSVVVPALLLFPMLEMLFVIGIVPPHESVAREEDPGNLLHP